MISPEEAGKIIKNALDEMDRDIITHSAEAANYIDVLSTENQSSVLILHDTQLAHEWVSEKLKAHEADCVPLNIKSWQYSYYRTKHLLLTQLRDSKRVVIWESYTELEKTYGSSLFQLGFIQALEELTGKSK